MDHIIENAGRIIAALPKGILLTTSFEDKVNSMVIGWGSIGLEWGRPIFTAYVRVSRYTRELLDKNPEFTVNVPVDEVDKKIIEICGSQSGRNLDKIKECGLTTVAPRTISVPAIRQFPITLECRVVYKQLQDLDKLDRRFMKFYPGEGDSKDPHIAYYGEILNAYTIQ